MPDLLDVVFADNDLLVLNKPSGLLTVPGRGPDKQDCLASRAQARYPGALAAHRLDMATSGLVVMGRNPGIHRHLSRAFADRAVDKRYTAVVDGRVAMPLGQEWRLIDLPLAADWPHRPRQQVDAVHGRPSQTRYRVLAFDAITNSTRLELLPLTGRTHQLRVHLQAIGHPICGDPLYGSTIIQAKASRLLLHANRLSFCHPVTGEQHCWSSAPPF